jgi:hypothetical protein
MAMASSDRFSSLRHGIAGRDHGRRNFWRDGHGGRKKDKKKKTGSGHAQIKTSDEEPDPRWINLWNEGERGRTKYGIEPNPHENSNEYRKKADDFYTMLAKALAGAAMEAKDQEFPRRGTVKWQGESCTLTME